MKNRNIAIGLFMGVAFGAAMGILFAPHRGTITRRMLRKKGIGLVQDATESIKESIGELGEKFETVKKDLKAKLNV